MSSATQILRHSPFKLARSAQIPRNFRPGGRDWDMVESVMKEDVVLDTDSNDLLITTVRELPRQFIKLVVPNNKRQPQWFIHQGHVARNPQVSPFLREADWPKTSTLTVVTARDRLIRVIPGEYEPPLPWQVSARQEDGGRQACLTFWRQHSYLLKPGITHGERQSAPDWFCKRRRSR